MTRIVVLFLSAVLVSPSLSAQSRGDAPPDTGFHAVAYVEVLPSSRTMAVSALKGYRDASRKQDGFVRIDLFEQLERPGHFVVVETWRDQKASDANGESARKELLNALQPIRVSGYDQRPYKTLSIAPSPVVANGRVISVVSHVDVTPDQRVPPLLTRLAEASRQEMGNVRFDVLQHAMRANHFTVIETWQSQRALDAHVAAAHTKQYRDLLQPMTGSPLDERLCREVE